MTDGTAELSELLQLVVDKLYLSIIIDPSTVIRYVGTDYAEVLGLPKAALLGKPIREVIPNSYLPEVLKTGAAEYGKPFVMKNNQLTVCNYIPLKTEDGALRGALAMSTFQDLDQVTALQSQLEEARRENRFYKKQLSEVTAAQTPEMKVVGVSRSITTIKSTIRKLADSDLPILLTGETGTGKEVFANLVHSESFRRYGNYVKINCAAIPADLLESELFGYEGGAFSGAGKGGKKGKFELADNGTLLLDEIGEMPLALQAKLLRVLQDHEVERIGGVSPVKISFRLVCSTNRNLEEMVAAGSFRSDLYFRINVAEISIPPLRERKEDIPPLTEYFIERFNCKYRRGVTGVDEAVRQAFLAYSWPGNVRELGYTVERMCVQSEDGVLGRDSLAFFLPKLARDTACPEEAAQPGSLHHFRDSAEYEAIQEALAGAGGNRSQAAKLLGISRSQLYVKLKKYGIPPR